MLLKQLQNQPILLDASVLLVGVEKSDENYRFENIQSLYMDAIFNYFRDILIHEAVMEELNEERRIYVESYTGKSVTIVTEENLYGRDPHYTNIFNTIAGFDLFKYVRPSPRDKGDVFSLTYAAFH